MSVKKIYSKFTLFFNRFSKLIREKYLFIFGLIRFLYDYYQYLLVIFWIVGIGFGNLFVLKLELEVIEKVLIGVGIVTVSLVVLVILIKSFRVKLVMFILVISLGMFYAGFIGITYLQKSKDLNNFAEFENKELIGKSFKMNRMPRGSGSTDIYTFKFLDGEYKDISFEAKLPKHESISFYDECKGRVEVLRTDNLKVLQGIYFTAEIAELNCAYNESQSYDFSNFIFENLFAIRKYIYQDCIENLSEPYASLLYGIITGDNPYFSKSFEVILKNAGVLHVVAASGANLAILFSIVTPFVSKLPRLIQNVVMVTIIMAYVFLAGMSASIVRAAVMLFVIMASKQLGYKNLSVLALFYSALIFTLITPIVIFTPSFLLSFSATLGILIVQIFKERLNWVADDIKISLAAGIFTTPISVFFFGTFSYISFLVNSLLVPIISSVMILGLIAIILGLIWDVLAKFIYRMIFFNLYLFVLGLNYFGKFELIDISLFSEENLGLLVFSFVMIFILIISFVGEDETKLVRYYFKTN